MRGLSFVLASCVLINSSLAAEGDLLPDEGTGPAAQQADQLRAEITRLEKIPENRRNIDDRLALSHAYLALGNTTQAVKQAFAARQADPENEQTWVALIQAQVANLHETVYAEENFQGAIRKFPHSETINRLREDLFLGQLKFGQPMVAVNHLASLIKFDTAHLDEGSNNAQQVFANAHRSIDILAARRVPIFAIEHLEQELQQMRQGKPEDVAAGFTSLLTQLATIRREMSPAEQSLKFRVNY